MAYCIVPHKGRIGRKNKLVNRYCFSPEHLAIAAIIRKVIMDAFKEPFCIAALYQFSHVEDPEALMAEMNSLCVAHDITGALILAHEGVNGTIAGLEQSMKEVMPVIQSHFTNLELKYSRSENNPFVRLRIRIKPEIVTMDFPLVTTDRDLTSHRGEYVDSQRWNEIISQPDVVILDTRNDYEIEVGSFRRSVNPMTKSFKEFPGYLERHLPDKSVKVAMFCTGGVRCEKASAYMKAQGYDTVYHLKGGILKYLEEVSEDESMFNGACFVFDRRTSVKHGLSQGEHKACYSCRRALTPEDITSEYFQEGVHCSKCFDKLTDKQKQANADRQLQILLAESKCEKHLGMKHHAHGSHRDRCIGICIKKDVESNSTIDNKLLTATHDR